MEGSLTQWTLAPESITQDLRRRLCVSLGILMRDWDKDMQWAHVGVDVLSRINLRHLHNTILLELRSVTCVDMGED